MAFVNQIPTHVPGLNHLATLNDKVLKPGLSVMQTAKDYVDTMWKEKEPPATQTHTIIIDRVPRRGTSPYESIDHEFTDRGSPERQRVQELLDNRSLNPPFPNRLPKRPPPKKKPLNRWKVGFFAMLLVFAAAVVPLAVLAARPKSSPDCDPHQSGQQLQATVTERETTTQLSLITQTSVRVTTRFSTATEVSIRTTLITDIPKATGIGS